MEMSSSNNQVGAEVRRLHVIYFLSRKGRIEHPHLIRVHNLSRNGVHLRDVKRWLAELRGKDMPESFAWSYKRRYKSGYVWQDLLDEDLITPISDNEYVLKGSEISSSSPKEEANMERKYSMQKREDNSCDHSPSFQEGHQDHHHLHLLHHQEENKRQKELTKMSSPEIIEEESHTFGSDKSSTLTEDYVDHQEEKPSSRSSYELSSKQQIHEEEEEEVVKVEKPSSLHPRKRSNKKANDTDVSSEEKIATASQPSFSKSKSYSNGGSLFRNWISCGAIDTNDSAMVTVNRRCKQSLNVEFSSSGKNDEDSTSFSKELLLKGDKLGASQRVSSTMTNWLHTKQSSGRKSFDGVRASPKGGQSCIQAYLWTAMLTMWKAIQARENACSYEILQRNEGLDKVQWPWNFCYCREGSKNISRISKQLDSRTLLVSFDRLQTLTQPHFFDDPLSIIRKLELVCQCAACKFK